MNTLKTTLALCIIAAFAVGCAPCGANRACGAKKVCKTDSAAPTIQLCSKCGEVKGSHKCCKPAEKCGKCGMHKGSPGCCKATK